MIRRGWVLALVVLLSVAITSACLAAGDAQHEKPIRIVLVGDSTVASYPKRQDPQVIKAEIAAARKLEAQGFVVFRRDHLYNEHLTAIQEAVEAGKPAPESTELQGYLLWNVESSFKPLERLRSRRYSSLPEAPNRPIGSTRPAGA